MMWVSKVPNYDAYGLFRALHSHNPFYAPVGAKHVPLAHSTPVFAYRGIIIPLLCSYLGGSQGLSSTYEQAHVDLDLLTLASLYDFTYISSTHSDKKSPDITVKTALSEDFPINSQNLCEITFHFSDNIQRNRSSE